MAQNLEPVKLIIWLQKLLSVLYECSPGAHGQANNDTVLCVSLNRLQEKTNSLTAWCSRPPTGSLEFWEKLPSLWSFPTTKRTSFRKPLPSRTSQNPLWNTVQISQPKASPWPCSRGPGFNRPILLQPPLALPPNRFPTSLKGCALCFQLTLPEP